MPPADAPAQGLALGPFTLDRLLGQGGFASVWAAHRADGGTAAIKILKPRYAGDGDFELRFRQESQFAANLSHPRIIKIGDIGREGMFVYFAMELFPGSLATRRTRAMTGRTRATIRGRPGSVVASRPSTRRSAALGWSRRAVVVGAISHGWPPRVGASAGHPGCPRR